MDPNPQCSKDNGPVDPVVQLSIKFFIMFIPIASISMSYDQVADHRCVGLSTEEKMSAVDAMAETCKTGAPIATTAM